MIARIWRTRVNTARMAEYERFARTRSLPMFRQQVGWLGVLFLRGAKDCATLSLWENMEAVERLATSPTYQQTVHEIESTGLLEGQASVEVFEVFVGALNVEALASALTD